MKIKNYSDGKSPALDIGLSIWDELNNRPYDEVSKKTLHIEIIERNAVVDFGVIDQSEVADRELEKDLWNSIKKVIGKKYGVKSWTLPKSHK
jgi:hypothetical protein|tara:strand:- start:343 stop:618 length:276 start_codon:yes stop_codon:yes gene_type:complete